MAETRTRTYVCMYPANKFPLPRHFAASNPRVFTARYDAYTQSIELLDSKAQIMKNMRAINRELRTLTDALEKLREGDD